MLRRAHIWKTWNPNFSREPPPSSKFFYLKDCLQIDVIGSLDHLILKMGAHKRANLLDWVTGTGKSAAFFSTISSKIATDGTRKMSNRIKEIKEKSKSFIPGTGVGRAWVELALVIRFIWSTLGINRPCDGIGVGASHIIDQKKKLEVSSKYLSHWESTWFLILIFLMWVQYDYTVDQPSVEPEGSSRVGLGHRDDDTAWGWMVDREEGGYLATWASLALEEFCCSYFATWTWW